MVKSVHVKLPDDVYDQLERIRRKKGKLSVPEVIRDAISEYIEKELSKVIING
jgi:metal-responsive CopG/Arc/MetJ family transcriptional regulator